jgi:hypothetical protein
MTMLKPGSHSWFINFDRHFKGPIPFWFHRWWQVHGPVHEILPEEVKVAIQYFSTIKRLSQQEAQLPITIHFFAQYKVSWILKWQYIFNQNCISRQFSVKWGDKFKFSPIQARLKTEFSEKSLTVPTVDDQVPAQPFPKASKSVSSSSSKGKKPSKEEIKAFARALAEQYLEARVEDDVDKEEASTAESSTQHYNFDPFQDAQNPFDVYDLDLDS